MRAAINRHRDVRWTIEAKRQEEQEDDRRYQEYEKRRASHYDDRPRTYDDNSCDRGGRVDCFREEHRKYRQEDRRSVDRDETVLTMITLVIGTSDGKTAATTKTDASTTEVSDNKTAPAGIVGKFPALRTATGVVTIRGCIRRTVIDAAVDDLLYHIPRATAMMRIIPGSRLSHRSSSVAPGRKGFKPVGIENYDGKTKPGEWLRIYSTTVKSAGGHSFVMASYLLVCLDAPGRFWLNSLPKRSIGSWGELVKKFVTIFRATCEKPGSHFDLTRVKQRPHEPLRDYIKRFCAKKTTIPGVPDQQVISAFQAGLRSDGLVHEISRRNHNLKLTTADCFQIADTYALGKSGNR